MSAQHTPTPGNRVLTNAEVKALPHELRERVTDRPLEPTVGDVAFCAEHMLDLIAEGEWFTPAERAQNKRDANRWRKWAYAELAKAGAA